PGQGSTFTALIPLLYASTGPTLPAWQLDPGRVPVLVVEDRPETLLLYDKYLSSAGFQALSARSVREAQDALHAFKPRAIVLDILLKGEDAWEFLATLRRRPDTADVPIVVVSTVTDERKALALGADV